MKKLSILIILIIFSSCYTVKKAQRQTIKANIHFPKMMTEFVAMTFPTKDSIFEKIKYIKGKNTIKIDTFYTVDCDSVVKDTFVNNKIIYKKYIEKRTDTVYRNITKVTKDTAMEKKLQNDIKALEVKNAELNQKNKWLKKFLFILGGGLVLVFYFKR